MMTKTCNRCKENKSLDDFHKNPSSVDGKATKCKVCRNEHNRANRCPVKAKQWRESQKDSFYTLYYLPREHYVGVTNYPSKRMTNHRCNGKDTEGYRSLYTFKTKREALDLELKFHKELGFRGAVNNKSI